MSAVRTDSNAENRSSQGTIAGEKKGSILLNLALLLIPTAAVMTILKQTVWAATQESLLTMVMILLD